METQFSYDWAKDPPAWWSDWQMLVDGELDPDQSGTLLQTIDRSTDGWKRCALWLLDEYYLKRELTALAGANREPLRTKEPSDVRKTRRLTPRARWPSMAVSILVLASFLIGVGLSLALNQLYRTTSRRASPTTSIVATGDAKLATPQTDEGNTDTSIDARDRTAASAGPILARVPLPLDENEPPLWVDIPVRYAVQELSQGDSACPAEQWNELLQKVVGLGSRVHQENHLYGFQLDDQHQLWVPVVDWRIEIPENADLSSVFKEP